MSDSDLTIDSAEASDPGLQQLNGTQQAAKRKLWPYIVALGVFLGISASILGFFSTIDARYVSQELFDQHTHLSGETSENFRDDLVAFRGDLKMIERELYSFREGVAQSLVENRELLMERMEALSDRYLLLREYHQDNHVEIRQLEQEMRLLTQLIQGSSQDLKSGGDR